MGGGSQGVSGYPEQALLPSGDPAFNPHLSEANEKLH